MHSQCWCDGRQQHHAACLLHTGLGGGAQAAIATCTKCWYPTHWSNAAGVVESLEGKCQKATSCGIPSHFTCADLANTCTCDGGRDNCGIYGTCSPSNCGVCSTCIASILNFTTSVANLADAEAIASQWEKYCAGTLNVNLTQCINIRDLIKKSSTGSVAKRAGWLCSQLALCNKVRVSYVLRC